MPCSHSSPPFEEKYRKPDLKPAGNSLIIQHDYPPPSHFPLIMKSAPIAALITLLLALAPFARAGEAHTYPEEDAIMSITFPDEWEVKDKNGRLYASPPDEEDFFVEVDTLKATPDDGEAVIKEAKESFEDLVYEEEVQKTKFGELGIVILSATGKDEHGKVAINIILIADEAKSKVCILTRIASPDAAKKHAPEWGKIVTSISAPKAKKAPKKEE
jgi:hypothetical protein